MGTTELHAEQVIVGGVVLCAAVLPWLPEVSGWLRGPGASELLTGAAAVAVAYIAGVIFDRLADTITEWLERCQRLLVAEKAEARARQVAAGITEGARPEASDDPFPEDALRMRALQLGNDVSAWIDYHRSRARITRALAVYLPLVTWSLVIGLTRPRGDRSLIRLVWLEPLALLTMIGAAAWLNRQLRVPRTDDPRELRQAFLDRADDATREPGRAPHALLLLHPTIWVSGTLLVAAITLAAYAQFGPLRRAGALAPTAACAALSALSWWAWWRISYTYRTYLQLAGRLPVTSGQ